MIKGSAKYTNPIMDCTCGCSTIPTSAQHLCQYQKPKKTQKLRMYPPRRGQTVQTSASHDVTVFKIESVSPCNSSSTREHRTASGSTALLDPATLGVISPPGQTKVCHQATQDDGPGQGVELAIHGKADRFHGMGKRVELGQR